MFCGVYCGEGGESLFYHVMPFFGFPACPCSPKRCIVNAPLIYNSVVSIASARMVMYSTKKLSGSIAFTFLS